ncbi:MAG: glycosyltransferase [Planctomycetales bacterium]|nr:glycosyltransferase [Planctomycetales bacterium]
MRARLLCCSGSLDGGGSERQLWQLATQIDPNVFAPQIYLHYLRGHYLNKLPDRIPIHAFWSEIPKASRLPGGVRQQQIKHLQEIIRRERIAVVYDRTFHMTLVTSAACRKLRIPRLSVIVSPPSLDFAGSRERFHSIKKWLLARAYRDHRAMTLAVSQGVADDAWKYYAIAPEKFVVVPSPVDIDGIKVAANEPLTLDRHAQQAMRIAVVGRLSKEKGQARAIEALSLSNKTERLITLDIIGDGPLRHQLEALAARLGVADQTNFWGHCDNPYPWIQAADLLCITSDYEGLANVALEAMALRTPVLSTDCGDAIRELLGKQQRGVVVPAGDCQALATEILSFGKQKQLWRSRIDAAEAWVTEHHSLPHWLTTMSRLILQAIAREPGR